MNEVSLLTDQDKETKDDLNKVTLMTVHAAKGLEFSYVFVIGLEENLFPSMMSGESKETLEEERRLFYVAITRARKRLFLSFATNRFRWGQYIDCEESRFINEIDDKFLEKKEFFSSKNINPYKIYAKTKNQNLNKKSNKNLQKLSRIKSAKAVSDEINKIRTGSIVKHKNFGEGKVLAISGKEVNKKATVFFNGFGQKQLLLKFAKLEIKKI